MAIDPVNPSQPSSIERQNQQLELTSQPVPARISSLSTLVRSGARNWAKARVSSSVSTRISTARILL
ncbi:hypothetical protein AAC387_Pa07g2185 [Persea americana]